MQKRSGNTCALFLATLAGLLVLSFTTAGAVEPSLQLVKKIVLKGKRMGNLDHLTVDSRGQRLFLANKINATVDVVDLKKGKLLRQFRQQDGAQGVAHAADLDRLFVGLG